MRNLLRSGGPLFGVFFLNALHSLLLVVDFPLDLSLVEPVHDRVFALRDVYFGPHRG